MDNNKPGTGGEPFKVIMSNKWFDENNLVKETVICKVEKQYKLTFWKKLKLFFEKDINVVDVSIIEINYGTHGEMRNTYYTGIDPYDIENNPIMDIHIKANDKAKVDGFIWSFPINKKSDIVNPENLKEGDILGKLNHENEIIPNSSLRFLKKRNCKSNLDEYLFYDCYGKLIALHFSEMTYYKYICNSTE